MAVVVRYAPRALGREQYERVNEILRSHGNAEPPRQLLIHVLFGDEGNMRVSEIWDSEEAWRDWYEGPLDRALLEAGVEGFEPEVLQAHELWGTGFRPS
jgi:heme-degrading monooxygenase HmoA